MEFDTDIKGIPCICKVIDYYPAVAMKITGWGYGDAEAPEDEIFEYEILDRKGYRAYWLESKITPDDEYRLLEEFRNYYAQLLYEQHREFDDDYFEYY